MTGMEKKLLKCANLKQRPDKTGLMSDKKQLFTLRVYVMNRPGRSADLGQVFSDASIS